jgi:hypothetical protein
VYNADNEGGMFLLNVGNLVNSAWCHNPKDWNENLGFSSCDGQIRGYGRLGAGVQTDRREIGG